MKKWQDNWKLWLLIVALIALISGYAGIYLAGCSTLDDDSPIEEIAEEVLENALESTFYLDEGHLDIDLTPDSPEKDSEGD